MRVESHQIIGWFDHIDVYLLLHCSVYLVICYTCMLCCYVNSNEYYPTSR